MPQQKYGGSTCSETYQIPYRHLTPLLPLPFSPLSSPLERPHLPLLPLPLLLLGREGWSEGGSERVSEYVREGGREGGSDE